MRYQRKETRPSKGHKKIRKIRIESDFAYIPLTKGYEAKIDLCDVEKVSKYNWYAGLSSGKIYYPHTTLYFLDETKVEAPLHKFLIDPPEGIHVDHKDRNPFNCTRDNLRLSTPNQNCFNKSMRKDAKHRFKGITFDKSCKDRNWRAQLQIEKRWINLGRFETDVEAARAYDEGAKAYFGEYACTNEDLGLYDVHAAAD